MFPFPSGMVTPGARAGGDDSGDTAVTRFIDAPATVDIFRRAVAFLLSEMAVLEEPPP